MLKTFFSRFKGIGLLELMLSLAIIAILLIMATRYYQSASTNQKINQAVDMFAALRSAETNYYHSQSSSGSYAQTVSDLVSNGYLPASYLDSGAQTSVNSSPWNTAISIGGATGKVTVEMTAPSSTVCTQLTNRLSSTISTETGDSITGECTSGYTVTANYTLS